MISLRRFFPAFLGFVFIFNTFGVAAEIPNLPFRRISPEGGFTLSPVIEIAQDKLGFVWFITREKLYQFNTQDFISFEPKYQSGISNTNNYITSMLIDRSNAIWIGTNAGISKFNKYTWQMEAVRISDPEIPEKVLFPTDIKQNQRGEIWMVESNYLALFDSASMQMKYVTRNNLRIHVNAFCFDVKDNIYAASNLGDMFSVNTRTLEVKKLEVDLSPVKLFGIYLINNILWVSTDGFGLRRYSTDGVLIDSYCTKNKKKDDSYSSRIRDVLQTSDGKIWIATYKGLLEWQENNVNQYITDFDNKFSLPDNSIASLMEDNQKGLWIGTWRGGVCYLNSFANTFESYRHSPNENSVSGNIINAIFESDNGLIWIGTDGQGLDVFNEQRKIFRHVELKGDNNEAVTNIKCILQNKSGDIWLGTYGQGIFRKEKTESNFRQYLLPDKNVYDMAEDDNGIWIATYSTGLYYYSYDEKSLVQHPIQSNSTTTPLSNNLKRIFIDTAGNLWVISNLGVFIKSKGRSNFEQFFLDNESGKGFTQVYTITGSKDGMIWLGTDNGIFSVNSTHAMRHYPIVFNGKQVSVYGIVFDSTGKMWISTNNGILSYDPLTEKFMNYGASDGLPGNLFNASALCQTSSGNIYFGSTSGMVGFRPASIMINPYKPKVYFSRIFINHKEILPGQENSRLSKPLYETDRIKMDPGRNSFSIEFFAQNFLNPQKNQFRYRLKGFDPNWIDAGSLTKATYTNISPGDYVFEVIACNNDMVWNMDPARLNIFIPRHFLLSWPALAIYLLLIVFTGIMVRRTILSRTRLEHQVEIERLKRLEEEKSHQNKLNFFTNISHELRTPLTLITGPAESLLKSPSLDQGSYNQLTLIKRNAGRLLKLINQLLEFRQIEENKTELNAVRTDIVSFVREIYYYFVDVARQKNIQYVFVSLPDYVPISFDPEKLDKAVFNLLSNAFKFTPDKGTIQVEVSRGQKNKSLHSNSKVALIGHLESNDYIQISVTDNGPGIARESIEKVFDRFYMADNQGMHQAGTGIGLHLTKHLILLHGGEIELESEIEVGSVFRIRLPYKEENDQEQGDENKVYTGKVSHPTLENNFNFPVENDQSAFSENWSNLEKGHKKTEKLILVVEDHRDLSNFICLILADEYRLLKAYSGLEGIEKAQLYLPDLIISDVMMPDKSGIDLVNELKNNLKTSHIPIVLLTALTSVENKIVGFASGADDYIEKPFDSQVLKARIRNIFAGRIVLQEYFAKKITLGFENEIPETPDQKMMAKAIRFVEKNLMDEKLDIELLAQHLNLSQSTLYRKLKSLTGKSATDFIRTIRLEYAARLLKEGRHNIEEVSTMAGFNSHSYFTRSFKEHFGKTPSDFVSLL